MYFKGLHFKERIAIYSSKQRRHVLSARVADKPDHLMYCRPLTLVLYFKPTRIT